jgi:hypothetical protein
MAAARRRKGPTDPEHRLIGSIKSTSFTYFIAANRAKERQFVEDEAIIDLTATIVKIDPPNSDHFGAEIECSLVCARRFDETISLANLGRPFFLSVTLKRNQRSMLAYLPSDAFWALEAQLGRGSITHIELSYLRPFRGWGDLTSIHFRVGE